LNSPFGFARWAQTAKPQKIPEKYSFIDALKPLKENP
jgi:hypothetical protein